MWQLYYDSATDLLAERRREAERERLVRLAAPPDAPSALGRVRRSAAKAVAGIAGWLDECAARETIERLTVDPSR